jgi:predicted dehydrogenase
MENSALSGKNLVSRRQFVKSSAVVSTAAITGLGRAGAFAAGSDKIRLGLVGCGGRGWHDAGKCLEASDSVELVAMGDMFRDRLDATRSGLAANFGKKVKVTDETCFIGFDACKKVLASGVDLVIFTTPPHFRPEHLRAAIEAGVHVFMEKPVAVDPVGVRSVIESGQLADRKGLTILAGTQMRRINHLVDGIKRLHDGAIGDILGGQCVRIGGGMLDWGPTPRKPEWTDMEWQLRRWLFLTWLSGDFIAEMHVHNLDLLNWVMGSVPEKVIGMGGREVRTGPEYGNIYDHMSAEYEYPNGVRIEYMGSQMDGVTFRNDLNFSGTKGTVYMDFGNFVIKGPNAYTYDGPQNDPCVQAHADQIDAMRNGKKLNEAKRIAESSLTAIMGRMSAYTGRALKWDWAIQASKLDLRPDEYKLGPLAMRPAAVPGQTPLI